MAHDKAPAEPTEPWRSFLSELDACLTGEVELRCFGGFVVAQHYGLGRETSDIDFVAAITSRAPMTLSNLLACTPGSAANTVCISSMLESPPLLVTTLAG